MTSSIRRKIRKPLRDSNPEILGGAIYLENKKDFMRIGRILCYLTKKSGKNKYYNVYPILNLPSNLNPGLYFKSENDRLVKTNHPYYNENGGINYDLQSEIYEGIWKPENIKENWWHLKRISNGR